MHKRVPIARDEAIACTIKTLAELTGASERLIHECFRMKSSVLSFGGDRLSLGIQWTSNISVGESAGDINPAVRSECRTGNPELLAAAFGSKSGEDDFAYVRFAVACGILEVPNIRSTSNEYATFPGKNSVGEGKTICEGCAFFKTTVAIGILQ